jgi:hypothetical protein
MDFATNAPHFIVPELKIIKSLLVGYKGGLYEHKQKHDARSNKNKTLMLTL